MADSTSSVERSVRFYRRLLRAYPRSFRQQYGDEMALVFRELAMRAWQRDGAMGLWLLWCRALIDLVRSSPREHVAQWFGRNGGTSMDVRTMLTRHLTSDETDRHWGRVLTFISSVVIPLPIVRKCMMMQLTPAQWIIAGLATGLLTLQIMSFGLLFSLRMGKAWSRLRHDFYQCAIYVILGLAFILGIWKLRSVTTSEFEFNVGFDLLCNVVMGAMFLGTFLGIIKSSAKPQDDNPVTVKDVP